MNPMKDFPKKGYAILFIKSGYTTTPLRCEVAHCDKEFRPLQPWVNYANDSVFDSGGTEKDLVGWLPLPGWDEGKEEDPALLLGAEDQWRCGIPSCRTMNHHLRLVCRNCEGSR